MISKKAGQVIGLAGRGGSGKDYVCEYLQSKLERPVLREAFADGVRDEVTEYLNLANPEETFTTEPEPAVRTMCGTTSRVSRKGLVRLKRTTFSKARSEIFSAGRGIAPPALFTSTPSEP